MSEFRFVRFAPRTLYVLASTHGYLVATAKRGGGVLCAPQACAHLHDAIGGAGCGDAPLPALWGAVNGGGVQGMNTNTMAEEATILDAPVVQCANCIHAHQRDRLTLTPHMRWCMALGKVRAMHAQRQCDRFEHPLAPVAIERAAVALSEVGRRSTDTAASVIKFNKLVLKPIISVIDYYGMDRG